MNKGERSRQRILKEAMEFASVFGLSCVTIGEISKRTNMSRTGVISHFKSKEDMQIAILKYSESEYRASVVEPAYHDNALKHLKSHIKLWTNWIEEMDFDRQASCPFIRAIIEYQDRDESPVKECIERQQKRLIDYIAQIVKRCIDQGYFKEDIKPYDFVFKVYSFYVGHNITKNLFGVKVANTRIKKSLNDLIQDSLEF